MFYGSLQNQKVSVVADGFDGATHPGLRPPLSERGCAGQVGMPGRYGVAADDDMYCVAIPSERGCAEAGWDAGSIWCSRRY